jgi:hypothetical protein
MRPFLPITFVSLSTVATASSLLLAAPAQAFSFTTNYTDTEYGSKGDIMLDSIEMEDGSTVNDFSLINNSDIVDNEEYHGGNSGAASTDKGDNVDMGTSIEDPTDQQLVDNLNNQNLNNIIDTEDDGEFQIDLFFDNPIDNLLMWERGMNSALAVQALNSDGELTGNKVTVDFRNLGNEYSAGYSINTQEIGGNQEVGSYGLTMEDLGVENRSINGFRFFSESSFNGPDWKIAGTNANRTPIRADVPEPSSLLGLLGVGSLGLLGWRRRQS